MNKSKIKSRFSILLSAMMLGSSALSVSATEIPSIKGDANADGVFNVSDVVLLQKWLLADPDTQLTDWQAVDFYADGRIDVFDLCLMKRELIDTVEEQTPTDEQSTSSYCIIYENGSVTLKNSDGEIVSESDSVIIAGETVTITAPGEYDISGKSTNGQLIVDVDKTVYPDGKAELVFSGLELSNTSVSPVYIANIGDECVITAKADTISTVSDGTSYANADGSVGAIYSCDDLKIKGKGTLNVNGNCEDGIVSKNDLRIFNGTINVNAVDDTIRGKDSVRIDS